ncbi:pimeloyl-ACP methyl ester carboxylesterase [Yoonia maricola]|uniref:Pimeloyl-ACP methyl ester carboxylesterase n=1 Tax=Yoonia maricola TaxID=420999 RepID=A0A2M8W652_9RHOB|nr:alpha/beta fold hydrolase [Yoonia maricola]PJI86406.1 pimeloyl-ACP methyl ester carboxylesterase [Yoonia maricola]
MLVWFVGAAVCVSVVYIAVRPFIVERRRTAIGPSERHRAKGEFVQLSQGVTHCRWAGSARGPVAVVVHGVASPMISMEGVADGLGRLGYRVLMYDLYGRGLSDAPKGKQDRAFFLRQLSDLCAYHGLTEELTIAGYSMGGSIATAFATEYPHSVKRVILLASAGVVTKESRFSRFCRRVPWLGDWAHAMFAHRRILKAIPARGNGRDVDAVSRAQQSQLNRRGYLPAILSSRRGMLAERQENDHRKLWRQGIPVTAIWGEADPVIPLRAVGLLGLWNRDARQEVVTGADHGLPYTHSAEMADALRAAMREV